MITQQIIAPAQAIGRVTLNSICDTQTKRAGSYGATADVIFYSWWRQDGYAKLPHVPNLSVELADDDRLIAGMARLDRREVEARMRAGHHPYVARLGGTPVAYGWSACVSASIGELGLKFAVPAGNRYLWDFATLSPWRGQGIYPRLLQAILAREAVEAQRFWIGHVRENRASGRGIVKAGFGEAGATEHADGRALGFTMSGAAERAQACAALLGLRIV